MDHIVIIATDKNFFEFSPWRKSDGEGNSKLGVKGLLYFLKRIKILL